MNYEDFRATWNDALQASGLIEIPFSSQETVNAASMDRNYQVFVTSTQGYTHPRAFSVSAKLSYRWDALLTARFATTEEDMLIGIYGRKQLPKTLMPLLRLDVQFQANINHNVLFPIPDNSALHKWVDTVFSSVFPLFPTDIDESAAMPEVYSWCQEPEVQLICSDNGQFFLKGLSMAAAQMIKLPRQWDDPHRRPDPSPEEALITLFESVYQGLEVWQNALEALVVS